MAGHGDPILVVYPGEHVNRSGQVVGHIYVNDGAEKFDVAGGPATARPIPDLGGHTATRTPRGTYVLDAAEHHTTPGWPNSVVPWGARIREVDSVVQYGFDGRWIDASGPRGTVTESVLRFFQKSGRHLAREIADRYAREMFYDQDNGKLVSEWFKNDFGNWSWNLRQNGARTVFFIHTTPRDEMAGDANLDMLQSHGCLHIRPRERDVMVAKGYLRRGVTVVIKRYEDRWQAAY